MQRQDKAQYGKSASGLTRAVFTCSCHGREFESRLALRLHAKQFRDRIRKDFQALVQEGQLKQNAWERLPGESPVQFNKFKTYVASYDIKTGQRSLDRTAKTLGVHRQHIATASYRWHWHVRAQLLDQHVERLELQAFIEDKKKSARRQAGLGKKLQELASVGASRLLADDERISEMSGHEIAKLADYGVKIERLANSDPTQISEDRTVRIVWEGPKPDWAPDDDPTPQLQERNVTTIEGER